MDQHRIAVVGGVAAGTAAAAHAARLDPSAQVTLFEQDSVISYGACEMPYFVQGLIERPEQLIGLSPEKFEKTRHASVRVRTRVLAIDPKDRSITVEDLETNRVSTEPFDSFILATGASPRKLGCSADDASNVLYFRTLADAVTLNAYLEYEKVQHAVVLGGGFIGIEVAESLTKRGIRTSIVQPEPGVLAQSIDDEFRPLVEHRLVENGITVRNDRAASYDVGPNGYVKAVRLQSGEVIGCQLVVVAIGVLPNVSLARQAGISLGSTGAIAVDKGMQTNVRNVFACGDCIEVERVMDGQKVHWPLARAAFRTARVAAENCVGRGRGTAEFEGVSCASAVKIFGLEVASVGLRLSQAVASGLDARATAITHHSRVALYPGSKPIHVQLVFDVRTGRVLGGECVGDDGAALRANVLVPVVRWGRSVFEFEELDLIYTPPVAPSADPLLIAASAARKEIRSNQRRQQHQRSP